jgi:hypothetical protein
MSAAFSPREIVARGRKIYDRHRDSFEREHPGKFLVIDISTEKFCLGASAEEAYEQAHDGSLSGPFHLVRIGARAAFRARRLNAADRRLL